MLTIVMHITMTMMSCNEMVITTIQQSGPSLCLLIMIEGSVFKDT